MSWKRYAIFVLLLLCSIGVDTAIDAILGIGFRHMGQNVAFVARMMDPIERTILVALLLLFLRKPIIQALGAMFGGNKPSGGASPPSSNPTEQQ